MKPAKYLLLGDTHGNLFTVSKAIDKAEAAGVTRIVQLGDWGFLWPSGHHLQSLRTMLQSAGMAMTFIDGNHDWHPEIWRRYAEGEFRSGPISYIPRGTAFLDGAYGLGGAASIDRRHRREGKSWWPEEVIAEADIAAMPEHGVDVLLTHDAPELPPLLGPFPGATPGDYSYCEANRAMIRLVVDRCRPRRIYHGHYHMYYESRYGNTEVIGLAADGNPGSMVLVDEKWDPVSFLLENATYKGRIIDQLRRSLPGDWSYDQDAREWRRADGLRVYARAHFCAGVDGGEDWYTRWYQQQGADGPIDALLGITRDKRK